MDFRNSDVIKQFSHKDKDKIITYIELFYSEKSELNHIPDLTKRKQEACLRADIDPLSELSRNLIYLQNESFNSLIFNYLSGNNSNKFVQLCADQQLLWEMQQEILKPIDGDSNDDRLKSVEYKGKVSLQANALLGRVNSLYSDIYKQEGEIEIAVMTIRDMLTYEQRLKKHRNVPEDQQSI